jgi:hypothetical protein
MECWSDGTKSTADSSGPPLINTPLQRGGRSHVSHLNCFNSFSGKNAHFSFSKHSPFRNSITPFHFFP